MFNRLIEGSLPITARLLADELGLKLHFGASGFSSAVDEAGGKHLYIPSLPLDDKIADALALGGIVHEDTHFGFTDFDAMNVTDPVEKQMTNILEDVRCEYLEIRKYPGARAVLKRMVAAMVAHGQFSAIKAEEGLAGVVWYVLYRLRAEVLDQAALQPLAASAAEIIKPLMPGASFQRLTAMMFEVLQCNNTADCNDLARQILCMLKEEAENPTPPEETQNQDSESNPQEQQNSGGDQGEQNNSGQTGDSSADNQQNGQSGDSDNDQGPQSESGQDQQGDTSQVGDSASNQDSAGGEQAGQQDGDGTETSSSFANCPSAVDEETKGEAMKQFLANGAGGDSSMDMGAMVAEALDTLQTEGDSVRLPDAVPLDRLLGSGADIIQRLRAETNAVRRKTQAVLESEARSSFMYGRSGNRLDGRRLWKVRTGDTRVFEKKIEGHKQDTAIQLLIDRSTSMRNRISVATDAALAVALAMDGVQGVTTSVAAFPYTQKGNADDVLLISEFGESFRKVASRFPAVGVQGCTPMAEALLWSGYHLHATTKNRKILFVVTDGQPDTQKSASEVISSLEQSGIEVMGLGINVDVSHLFTTSGLLNDISELAMTVFNMLKEKLAKAA